MWYTRLAEERFLSDEIQAWVDGRDEVASERRNGGARGLKPLKRFRAGEIRGRTVRSQGAGVPRTLSRALSRLVDALRGL